MNEIICNKIQTVISLCKENLETMIEKKSKVMFKWNKLLLLVDIWWAQIHYLNEPFWTFRTRKTRMENNVLIDNRQKLCEHGVLHPMIATKGKYTPGKVYNTTKETFIKIGNLRVCWDLIQVKKFQISLIMTYQRAIRDVTFVSENYGMTCQKILRYWRNYIFFWGP